MAHFLFCLVSLLVESKLSKKMRNQRHITVEKYTKAVACQIYHSKKLCASARAYMCVCRSKKKSENDSLSLKIMQMFRDLVTLLDK